jgi:hypothetical protein
LLALAFPTLTYVYSGYPLGKHGGGEVARSDHGIDEFDWD